MSARWADVKYLKESFTDGVKGDQKASHYGKGDVPLPYVRTDTSIFQSEIGTITPANGAPLFAKYCATCHGADGKGSGPGTKNLVSGGPAAYPKDMNYPYIFGRVRSGVPNTMMYGFKQVLTEMEIWEVTAHVVELTGGKFGG
jgi:mono/diheme cytochrome c family protein